MTKALEQALKSMALNYLKRQVNKNIYNRWDRGGYGRVPLPEMPYKFSEDDDRDIMAIIAELEKEEL